MSSYFIVIVHQPSVSPSELKFQFFLSSGLILIIVVSVDIFKKISINSYQLTEKIASHSGARTSLLIPQLNRLIVASPKSLTKDATLLIYEIGK